MSALTASEVCDRLGMDRASLGRLVSAGVSPSGGGGGERGQKHRWHEADLGVLAVCQQLHDIGASPVVLNRVVEYLHHVDHVGFGMLLVVGQTWGPRVVDRDTLSTRLTKAEQAVIVLDLNRVRRLLSQRGAPEATS